MKETPARTAIERDLIHGLKGFVEDLKSGRSIIKKYTCHRMVLDLDPTAYKAEDVKAARAVLRASQALFAKFLGVSVKTVRAWEQGKPVGDMACRFMDEIRRDPTYWRKRLKQSAKMRSNKKQPA